MNENAHTPFFFLGLLLVFSLVSFPFLGFAATPSSPNLGTVIGGTLGGVVGNQFGGGKGKIISTVFGVIGGAYLGNIAGNLLGGSQGVAGVSNSGEGGGGNLFGGRIGSITVCTCSVGEALGIGPPRGGSLLLAPGSRIYANSRIAPGMWVLGDYSSGGICLVRAGKYCYPVPVKGTIIKIGTS